MTGSMTLGTVHLVPSLRSGGEARATELLAEYYAPMTASGGYTGGQWDTFDPSHTREASPNVFTGDDVVSCALLAVPLESRAAWDLLDPEREPVFGAWLEQLPRDLDLVDVEPGGAVFQAMRGLYRELVGITSIGETTATKLMARKRPRLVPIVDRVVRQRAFGATATQWEPLREALTFDDRWFHTHLLQLRDIAGLPEAVSPLRVFDVLTWMDNTPDEPAPPAAPDVEPVPQNGNPVSEEL